MQLKLSKLGFIISKVLDNMEKDKLIQKVSSTTIISDVTLPDTDIYIDRDSIIHFTNDLWFELDKEAGKQGESDEIYKSTRDSTDN